MYEMRALHYIRCPSRAAVFAMAVITCGVFGIVIISTQNGVSFTDYVAKKHSEWIATISRSPVVSQNVSHDKFPLSDFRRGLGMPPKDFWTSQIPSYKCPSDLKLRFGSIYGGKWVCGVETLGKHTMAGHKCTVYSFGVGGDSSFEQNILQRTLCSVFAYDPTVNKIGKPLDASPTNPRVHFQKIGISGLNEPTKKTLKTLMTENGHTFVDILKVDVEGAEFDGLKRIMEDFDILPFGQLLVEVHNFNENVSPQQYISKEQILSLLESLEGRGLRAFSIELNVIGVPNCCSEFSFINIDYIPLFVPVVSGQ